MVFDSTYENDKFPCTVFTFLLTTQANKISASILSLRSENLELIITIATFSLAWEDEKYWGQQEPTAGYLHRLAVRKAFHGIGAGDFALDRAMHRQSLRLDCDCRNTSLCAYYEARGFVQAGIRPIPGVREYIAALYEKTLA